MALRLRAISHPRRAGVVRKVAAYVVDVGPVEVRRPVIEPPADLALPTVTVGDTVSVAFSISNGGTEALEITEIRPSTPSRMWIDKVLPITLLPGAHAESLRLWYAPVEPVSPIESIFIESNDPINEQLELQVATDVRGLTVQTQHLVSEPAPLGQAITVQSIPTDSVIAIERAVLDFHPRGDLGFHHDRNETFRPRVGRDHSGSGGARNRRRVLRQTREQRGDEERS